MIHSRQSGDRAHRERESDEVKLALHHYGLSRLYGASRHPLLSFESSHLAKLIIAQQDRAPELDLSSSTRINLSNSFRASESSKKDGEDVNYGMMPHWQQIHNRNCRICDNLLLLGLTCRSIKQGGFQCDVCRTTLIRPEADKENKRKYRSIRVRRSLEVVAKDKSMNGKKRKWEFTINGAQGSEPKTVFPAFTPEASSAKMDPLTLEEKRAQMKRKAKEKKKKEKIEPTKIDWISDKSISIDSNETTEATTSSRPRPISITQAVKDSKAARKAELHRMLMEMKTKKDNEKKSQSQQGGLQDFLGSI